MLLLLMGVTNAADSIKSVETRFGKSNALGRFCKNDVGKQILAVDTDTSMFLGDVILETKLSGEAVHCGDGRHLVPEPP